MLPSSKVSATIGLLLHAVTGVLGVDDISFTACPLIGTYYSPPTFSKSSDAFAKISSEFSDTFDKLIAAGGSETYGPISPNTTSFSLAIFSGEESMQNNPAFFEYHYTSPKDESDTKVRIDSNTKFPIGDLTMIFTVYAWLVTMGENWSTPITHYLPELRDLEQPLAPWGDITIGALAGHTSGLIRQSDACTLSGNCDWDAFVKSLAADAFVFQPDTTPVVSHTAFQLLSFAMQRTRNATNFSSLLNESIVRPLNMTMTSLLSHCTTDVYAIDGLNMTQAGDPGALALVSSITDLTRAGHSMLSSALLSSATTRRWLHRSTDTSNLRNGAGAPWEIYRAGSSSISPVVDAFTKSGTIGHYAGYFGLAPDFNVGFAIVAHDSSVLDRKLDLNVYADIVSEALGYLSQVAAGEMALRYSGTYSHGNQSVAVLNTTDDGPGLRLAELTIDGADVVSEVARKLGIQKTDLDYRLYPTNVQNESNHQFVAVFQDRDALIDAGTPTCITWQEVGADGGPYRSVFGFGADGVANELELPGLKVTLQKVA